MAIQNPTQQNYGLKIAQIGYDARNAPDYELAFSSSWPSLPIVKTFTVTVQPTGDIGQIYAPQTFTHNLGFYAWAQCWETGNYSVPSATAIQTMRRNDHITFDKNAVYWNPSSMSPAPTIPVTVHIKVYNIDISKPVSYNYVQPPAVAVPYDNNYGIKIVKEGKSIYSSDLRDFIIHSRAQSPAILTVLNESSAINDPSLGSVIKYTNPQGYANWIFGYAHYAGASDTYTWAPVYSQSTPRLFAGPDSTHGLNIGDYILSYGTGDKASLIVMRDPLFAANNVQVTY